MPTTTNMDLTEEDKKRIQEEEEYRQQVKEEEKYRSKLAQNPAKKNSDFDKLIFFAFIAPILVAYYLNVNLSYGIIVGVIFVVAFYIWKYRKKLKLK